MDYLEAVSRYPSETVKRLSGWRNRTLVGFDQVLRTPVYFDRKIDTIVGDWRAELDKMTLTDEELILERDEEGKIGPLSIQMPWSSRRDSAESFMPLRPFKVNEAAFLRAVSDLRTLIPEGSLRPLSVGDALLRAPKGTNSGLPTFSRDRKYLSQYRQRANVLIKGGDAEIQPFVAGWRGQAGGYEPKPSSRQRLLFMADRLEGIVGGRFMYVVLDTLKGLPEFAAWTDLNRVRDVMEIIMLSSRNAVFSTDFTGFDASVPAEVIHHLFDVIASWFSDVSGLSEVQESFVHKGLLTPEDLIGPRHGGIPSGSVFTNLIGTFINFVCARYVSYSLGVRLVQGTYLGDDAVNVFDPAPDVKEVEHVGKEMNLDLNAAKQYVKAGSSHYLQNLYEIKNGELLRYGGVRSTMRALGGILHYERQRSSNEGWTPAMSTMRTIMQLENCKWHPGFSEFVKFIANGDRRLLEVDALRLARLAGGISKVEEVLGVAAFRYTSQSVSALNDFRTVQVLRELSR